MILTTTAKVGTIQQNYNVIGEVNLRVKEKGFTHEVMQKKNNKNSSVYSANVIFSDDVISFTLSGETFESS